MNAENREYAAWRTFGLLSPDGQKAFDAAVEANESLSETRDHMEALAAAISVTHSRPVTPGAGLLEKIRERCGLSKQRPSVNSRKRLRPVLQWAGWGVAATLAVLLAVREKSGPLTAGQSPPPSSGNPADNSRRPGIRPPGRVPLPDHSLTRTPEPDRPLRPLAEASGVARGVPHSGSADPSAHTQVGTPAATDNMPVEPTAEPAEKRKLIQEIETLTAELKRTRQQNGEILSPAPGRSWPLVVEMKPPANSRKDSDPPLSSQIADALAGKSVTPTAEGTSQPPPASAIPVYDPARDTGTLAVRNLPAAPTGSQYHLWVGTADAVDPVFVGTLPDNLFVTDSLDFSLGSTGIVPTAYYLTLNSTGLRTATVESVSNVGQLVLPNSSNIVLQGP
jgi:hypothetical protein